MHPFMDKDFLLHSETAKKLYHLYAENMPIYDYHCHINPEEILRNVSFDNLTQLWLGGDHYKWRAMRSYGIEEARCTGDADDYSKFAAFVETLSAAPGNPLYHWAHLELQRYFGVYDILCPANTQKIWEATRAQLGESGLRCRDFITRSNVKVICTTDDPADSLETHRKLKAENLPCRVLPAFRPDRALELTKPDYTDYIQRLSAVCGLSITSLETLEQALAQRLDFFHENGCRLSDTGLTRLPMSDGNPEAAGAALRKRLQGEMPTQAEEDAFKIHIMLMLGRLYAQKDWCMQLHLGPIRNNNTRAFQALGPDTGFDSVGDFPLALPLSRFLDALERDALLPRTILYSINPRDYPVVASMLGNFQGSPAGKIQMGSAWWFADHKEGIEEQLKYLAAGGILGKFVGMLTDSRSFTSYPRHEYFRRILCNLLGTWVEDGEYPEDWDALEKIVRGICYYNAVEYFHM